MEPSGPDLADAGSSGPFWAGWCQPAKRANAARRRRGRAVPSGLAGPAVVATQHRSPLSRALRGPAAERLISAASRVSHLPPLYLSRLSVSRLSVSRLNVSRLNVSRLSVSRPSAPGALHRASPRPWPTAPQMRRRARAHAHTHRRTRAARSTHTCAGTHTAGASGRRRTRPSVASAPSRRAEPQLLIYGPKKL